jgi:hypothetical protein
VAGEEPALFLIPGILPAAVAIAVRFLLPCRRRSVDADTGSFGAVAKK